MSKALRISMYLLYAAIGLTVAFFAVPQTGWRALSVQTGSMTPAIPKGSLVLIHTQPLSDIQVGQVVTYRDPAKPSVTITHRVIATRKRGGLPFFTTKGDANKAVDPEIPGGSIVGVVQYHIATLGNIVNWLRTPLGIIALVGIPGLIIIISEFQLMIRRLQEYAREEAEERASSRSRPQPVVAALKPSAQRPVARRPRAPIIHLAIAALLVVPLALTVPGTRSQLSSPPVTLANNQLGVAARANHLLINEITLGGGNVCGQTSNTLTISNTGPGSTATINISSTCTITSTSSNNVSISNSSNQTATSGDASASGNTSGGSATSGSASNTSSSSTTVTINNGSGTTPGTPAAIIQLYNPTSAAVSLAGWHLASATASQAFGASLSVPAHGSLAVAYSAETLQRGGGRLLLVSPSGAVDAVSWGSDASQLNPAAPAIGPSGELERVALGFDSDTAADWQTH